MYIDDDRDVIPFNNERYDERVAVYLTEMDMPLVDFIMSSYRPLMDHIGRDVHPQEWALRLREAVWSDLTPYNWMQILDQVEQLAASKQEPVPRNGRSS